MSILIAAAIGAALPWLFTLIWAFIYWDFVCFREMAGWNARAAVLSAVFVAAVAAFVGAAQ